VWLRAESQCLVDKWLYLGTSSRVAVRLIAARMPEALVNAWRRKARRHAQKRGYPPSQAHLALLAWNLLRSSAITLSVGRCRVGFSFTRKSPVFGSEIANASRAPVRRE
jgi:hypothetical protein